MTELPVIGALGALARTWRGWIILVVVTTQLLLPLHYYLANRDPQDERFAWRMFSPMRQTRCVVHFTVDDKPLALGAEYHEAWLELAQRGRFAVIEAIGADQCRKHPGARVRTKVDCTYLGEPPRTWGGADLCTVPEL